MSREKTPRIEAVKVFPRIREFSQPRTNPTASLPVIQSREWSLPLGVGQAVQGGTRTAEGHRLAQNSILSRVKTMLISGAFREKKQRLGVIQGCFGIH